MKKYAYLLCSTAVLMPSTAFAQSTGTVDFEKDTIVVTGTRNQDVGGVRDRRTWPIEKFIAVGDHYRSASHGA